MERLLKRLLRLKDGGQQTVPDQQGSLEHAEKNERKRHKYLMLLAVLAASITYQAGLNPPGGFWYDDPNHVAGNPVLHDIHPWRYRTFFIFNGISFMASIVVIMFLLEKSVRKKVVTLEVLHLIMILDLLALMTAFAAGSCQKFRTSMYVYVLIVAVVVYLVLAIGVASSIAKCLKTKGKK
uniref:PGG domain-containing protein n=1 Tax=Hordeum vulgare subsp. vulgare TaxID=112509 RepID=A0A8I6YDS1_HORVV